jgi:hypothetical protein
MKIPQEDKDKIKQLITNPDTINIKLGIVIAIKTFNMTIDELIDLIDGDDVMTGQYSKSLSYYYYLTAFGCEWRSSVKDFVMIYYHNHRKLLHNRIKKYLNEE